MAKRNPGPYRRDYSERLDVLESRRVKAGVTLERWIEKCDMGRTAFFRARKDGCCFPARLKEMSNALRSIVREDGNLHLLELFDE